MRSSSMARQRVRCSRFAGFSAVTRIIPAATTRFPERHLFHFARSAPVPRDHSGCHGYPTSDPVRDFLVFRVAPVGGVAEGDATAAAPCRDRRVYEALPGPRELPPGADRIDLRLQTTAPNGDKVVQILTFHRGSYVIDVAYDITNNASAPVAPYAYFQFTRDTKAQGSQNSMAPVSYTGPVIYNETDKFKKVEFGDLDKLAADPTRKLPYTKNADNGWVGMVEHYFVAAWLPPDDKKLPREFYARKLEGG